MGCVAEVLIMRREGFKERFNLLRAEKNLTLEEIANEIKRNKATLSLVANGKAKLTDNLLNDLSEYFEVSKAYLLGETSFRTHDEELPKDFIVVIRSAIEKGITTEKLQATIDFLETLKDKK